jgi:hypothetical protein
MLWGPSGLEVQLHSNKVTILSQPASQPGPPGHPPVINQFHGSMLNSPVELSWDVQTWCQWCQLRCQKGIETEHHRIIDWFQRVCLVPERLSLSQVLEYKLTDPDISGHVSSWKSRCHQRLQLEHHAWQVAIPCLNCRCCFHMFAAWLQLSSSQLLWPSCLVGSGLFNVLLIILGCGWVAERLRSNRWRVKGQYHNTTLWRTLFGTNDSPIFSLRNGPWFPSRATHLMLKREKFDEIWIAVTRFTRHFSRRLQGASQDRLAIAPSTMATMGKLVDVTRMHLQ